MLDQNVDGAAGEMAVHLVVRGLSSGGLDTVLAYVNSHTLYFKVEAVPHRRGEPRMEWHVVANPKEGSATGTIDPEAVANAIRTYYQLHFRGCYKDGNVEVLPALTAGH